MRATESAIGKLSRKPLREVWINEALDFTRWLEVNIDVLNEVLGLTLTTADREQRAGTFSVDLIAEDEAGNSVIIENQLEKSNHEHLGKLITYATALGAKKAVWIVADPRPEHVGAISWLNESRLALFYLVKVEAVQIGNSDPAPLLTLIVGPSDEGALIGDVKKDIVERYEIRQRFWSQLLEKAKQKTRLHSGVSAGQYGWVGTGAGRSGLSYNYVIRKNQGNVEIYIDRGSDRETENDAIFQQLLTRKEEVETAFGEPLEWEPLEGRRACRIKKTISLGGYRDEQAWERIQEAMIDAMVRLERALRPQITSLTV